MTTNEIRNRIHELDNEMFYLEMADCMTTAERDTYQRLLLERNRTLLQNPRKRLNTNKRERNRFRSQSKNKIKRGTFYGT